MSRLLLLSNSTMPGEPFFSWPARYVSSFLGDDIHEILFISYAAVTFSYADYTSSVTAAFHRLGYRTRGIHTESNPKQAVESAEAIVIGGGNTFVLLDRLYQNGLFDLIKEKIKWGTPYIGWSAGANVACPTIMTTNDMPVVQPTSFEALSFVPFQINPHYTEYKPQGHGGETRQQRIEEFLVMNPERRVVGLPEGMLLQRDENSLLLHGSGTAVVFEHKSPLRHLTSGEPMEFLLKDKVLPI